MKILIPAFYTKFRCKANLCTDSCCIGWDIFIDRQTLKKYKSITGFFGKRLKENIKGSRFQLTKETRCPFLNTSDLCEIHTTLGENFLCEICKEHPRFINHFFIYEERGLGLCCEEACRLLLESKSLSFTFSEEDIKVSKISEEEFSALQNILNVRNQIFELLENKKMSFEEKLRKSFLIAKKFDGVKMPRTRFSFKNKNFKKKLVSYLNQSESYNDSWKMALEKINSETSFKELFSEKDLALLFSYFIFRYFSKAFFDGNSAIKVLFGIAFVSVLKFFGNALVQTKSKSLKNQKIDAIKLLSKQLEYSETNMKLFEDFFS